MSKPGVWVPYVVVMVVVIVGMDPLFFQHRQHTLERLLANVGIGPVFVAFYLRFLRHP